MPQKTLRKDYKAPAFVIDKVDLTFDLALEDTTVVCILDVRRNDAAVTDLFLHGEVLTLISLALDQEELTAAQYQLTPQGLTIFNVPNCFQLAISNRIHPDKNSELLGLYASNGRLFTQCEAEGFRRITYFTDRPDVQSIYSVTLRAQKADFPILLSNGNLVSEGMLADGIHYAKWHDPFRKPCYLFALVAGDFVVNETTISRPNKSDALLQVWSEPQHKDQTDFALESLRQSILWDRKRFNLDLDLDRFMIVVAADFNMGAMENKGLNIFNAGYVLANPEVATDRNYCDVEAVVAHEYFHNWTGNRVTCRDWFQLSLKEGLTVFRDQEFSADRRLLEDESGADLCRIRNVKVLREKQFPEDAGPMAHPIRPDAYVEIGNFYTATVYEKGAEVVRMLQTLLGQSVFDKGVCLYLEKNDGTAAKCEDFVAAMAEVSGRDLSQFMLWYQQAGTPHVTVESHYDASAKRYSLTFTQDDCTMPVLHIPIVVGLLDANGKEVLAAENSLLELRQQKQTFTFDAIDGPVVPSLLRGFSAPIELHQDMTDQELLHLARFDSDGFNRWESSNHLAKNQMVGALTKGALENPLSSDFIDFISDFLCTKVLAEKNHFGYASLLVDLPNYDILFNLKATDNHPLNIVTLEENAYAQLAHSLLPLWQQVYDSLSFTTTETYALKNQSKRALKNTALRFLVCAGQGRKELEQQYRTASSMNDRISALSILQTYLTPRDSVLSNELLEDFYQRYHHEPLLLDKWFAIQAAYGSIEKVQELCRHSDFTTRNPNRLRSVIFVFCMANLKHFHALDGSGYALWQQYVLLTNDSNAKVSARLARALEHWRHYVEPYRERMHQTLLATQQKPLDSQVAEVINAALEK